MCRFAVQEKDALGIPWGMSIQPFGVASTSSSASSSAVDDASNADSTVSAAAAPVAHALTNADALPRCESCRAYASPFAVFDANLSNWTCALCKHSNLIHQHSRCESGEYIAAVQLGLQALIEALPRDSRFALVTFSDKIGLYNLTCTVPHVTYIGVGADAVPQPSLAALLPLQLGAVPLHSHETRISQAITSLIGASVSHSAEKRAFGAALDLVLDYVLPAAGSSDAADLLNVRVSCFLAGGINYGLGSAGLEPRAAPAAANATVDDPDLLRPLSNFFRVRAERAALCGATIDLLLLRGADARSAAATHYHLPTIKFLSMMTGGALLQYQDANETANLPHDLYRLITLPRAYHGALRVRTTPDMAVANAYGELVASPSQEGVFVLASCTADSTVLFDFKFTNPVGFSVFRETITMQVAFAYSVRDTSDGHDDGVVTVKRRLRLWTVQVETSEEVLAMHRSVDAQQVLQLVTAKVIRASLDNGLHAARLLLQDWLVVLLTFYNERRSRADRTDTGVDVAFMQCESLKPLPRWVFALSRSALLLPPGDGSSRDQVADGAVLLHARVAALTPSALQTVLYPRLAAYSTMQKMIAPSVHLSQAAVHANASSARVYVADSYLQFLVYYTPLGISEALPFPPAKGSLVRQALDNARRARTFVPRVVYARADSAADSRLFAATLIEEASSEGAPSVAAQSPNGGAVEIRLAMVSAKQSFLQFVDGVAQEVDKLGRTTE